MPSTVSKWIYYTVIPALLPVVWFGMRLVFLGRPITLNLLFGRGELLLATSAFVIAGLGDLIASGRKYQRQKLRVGGCCIVLLCLGINAYADVTSWVSDGQKYNELGVAWFTLLWCGLSIFSGAGCIVLAEQR